LADSEILIPVIAIGAGLGCPGFPGKIIPCPTWELDVFPRMGKYGGLQPSLKQRQRPRQQPAARCAANVAAALLDQLPDFEMGDADEVVVLEE
jgi:hypothetical protein